jgi:peptidoglycan/LPS O-acetylase OafA/YrhL
MSLSKYRSDIDGLRAIAVISVMLYHAGISTFGGGFIGVDIFFVISGYLITFILIDEIENNKFKITTFYERRIRRIIPALLFMMIVSSAVFYFILLPDDLENFGQSIVATLAFSNNILLWMTSGYFESSIDLKPLAHTWSLGVEEQFYIITPIFLIVFYRILKYKGILIYLFSTFILSFIFCIFASSLWSDANFYLIFSRIWEIGAGSIAATATARSMRDKVGNNWAATLSNLSLFVILISPYAYKYNDSNPNAFTFIVILATYLLISFNKPEFFAAKFLSNRLFVFIGALSYSLYLWHQPIYVFIRVTNLTEPDLVQFAIGAIATFILGYLSWRFVELPFRNKQKVTAKILYLTTGTAQWFFSP